MHEVIVLFNGYSKKVNENKTDANCSCTLIKGSVNVIVDTMTAWDRDKIVNALTENNITPEEINYVVCTHSHPDHIGNNNLFTNAEHIVGYCIQKGTIFDESTIIQNPGGHYIHGDIKIVATPGHTLEDVTVFVNSMVDNHESLVAIVGDLFENEHDIDEPAIWKSLGNEELQELQAENRYKVVIMADYIIPGHGPMFKVTEKMKKTLKTQLPIR